MSSSAAASSPDRPPSQVRASVARYRSGAWTHDDDVVAGEEPMEIRLIWQEFGETRRKSIAVTMRTPGDDFELAAGFLFGEGILRSRDDLIDIAYCTDPDIDAAQAFNVVTVTLRPGLAFDPARLERNFYTSSSCGVCGKATLESLEVQGCSVLPPGLTMNAATICRLPAALRDAQRIFSRTGGLHAAGLFDRDGNLLALKEDVGRHNAMDKLVGSRFLAGTTPLDACALALSGRASFELLQKALAARIPLVVAIGAPSSLAVSLAESFGTTLAGFARAESFNVYTHPQRIAGATPNRQPAALALSGSA